MTLSQFLGAAMLIALGVVAVYLSRRGGGGSGGDYGGDFGGGGDGGGGRE